jgi:hypothetical protein
MARGSYDSRDREFPGVTLKPNTTKDQCPYRKISFMSYFLSYRLRDRLLDW